jgi:PBS lyase HEAT-like repeat
MTVTIDQLIIDLKSTHSEKKNAAYESILKMGIEAVPFLIDAYRSNKIDQWNCFPIIFKMGPSVYKDILPLAKNETEEACSVIWAIAGHREPIPEAIEIILEGLRSSNEDKVLACLGALFETYPHMEVHYPAQVDLFKNAASDLLNLIFHDQTRININAAMCLALIRPNDLELFPKIVDALERELNLASRMEPSRCSYILKAIGSYGPKASTAIPVLENILQTNVPSFLKVQTAETLAQIGSAAYETVPILEHIRDTAEFSIKSDRLNFQRNINKPIKAIQKAVKPLKAKSKGRKKGDPYLLDLIERMGSDSDGVFSSATSTSSKAYEEVRHLSDESFIDKLTKIFQMKVSTKQFYHATYILGTIIRNTDSQKGRDLLMDLFSRTDLRKNDLRALIVAAKTCKFVDVSADIRKMLFEKKGEYVTYAFDYFEACKDENAINDIVTFLRSDSSPHTRLLGIFTLWHIGSPKAVPFLLEMAKREYTSRKKEEREWRYYSIIALGEMGDKSVVPDLIALLDNTHYWDEGNYHNILYALRCLQDEQAYEVVLKTLIKILNKNPFTERWKAGFLTKITNCLCYFERIGKSYEPKVLELVKKIKKGSIWGRLLKEEREFISEIYPGEKTTEDDS